MAVRKRAGTLSKATLAQRVQDFLSAKDAAAKMKGRAETLRDQLREYTEQHGLVDSDGHVFPKVPGDDSVVLKREKRSGSKYFDEDKAEAILKRKKMLAKCQTTITVLDENKVLTAYQRKELTEKEVDAMYSVSEPTYAFKVLS